MIGSAVELAVTESPQWQNQRNVLVGKLVEALETSASWVDLYGITGQLNVPEGRYSDDILEPLGRIKEVCIYPPCYLMQDLIWMDVPDPYC